MNPIPAIQSMSMGDPVEIESDIPSVMASRNWGPMSASRVPIRLRIMPSATARRSLPM